MMKYCCDIMTDYICYENKNSIVQYDSYSRLYTLKLIDVRYGTHQEIWYCPWCGKKLPNELSEEWGEILKKEYGVAEPFFEDKDKVPEEFKTDEWWKKRGL